MSGSRKRVQLRRVVVPLVGVAVVLGSLTGLQSALSPAAQSVADASAVRSNEATANRGSGRSSEAALVLPEATLAPEAAVAETTTEAPTTAAPTTSTGAAPTTVAPTTAVPITTAAPTTTAAPVTTAAPAAATSGNVETGKASYYDYKPGGCAHKTIPKGTVITVTNLSNGKSTTCVVNDRGPYIAGRIIDLETDVFKQVSSTSAGVFNARISW